MNCFKYWCYKVLPLVYDDSLSYYEVLCKVVNYINNLIAQDKIIVGEVNELKNDIAKIQEIIDNFDTTEIERIVNNYLATMIFVEISQNGYFIYYIPASWDDVKFNTTGLDTSIPNYDYGRLVLSY